MTKERKISWKKATEMSWELVKQMNKDGFSPYYIIGISRGGYFPAAFINEMLVKWSRMTFMDIGRNELDPDVRIIKESSFCENIDLAGKKILLCDDVNETGLTFITIKKYLEQKGAEVKVLCFFSHPTSRIVPDYVIDSAIVFKPVFPWEDLRNIILP